jgi:hypothetical protein
MDDCGVPDDCKGMGPEVTALVRGELSPAEEVPVRAHLASCPACAALEGDLRRILAAAAARPSPVPDDASRERLAAALDVAWDEADAADRARGPVVRLLENAGRRYADSRKFRFLVYSLGAHAAAAVVLAVWLSVSAYSPLRGPAGSPLNEREGSIDIASSQPLPPVDQYDPLEAPEPPPPARSGPDRSGPDRSGMEGRWPLEVPAEVTWLNSGTTSGARDPEPYPETHADLSATFRMYPGEEMRAFAAPRFRRDLRERRMALAYGPVEGPRAALTVERGARYLAAAQDPDGTWASGRPGDPRAQLDRFRGGVTGMSVLALLGDGRTAMRPGPFASNVKAGVTALVRSQDRSSGLLGGFARGAADDRPLCNHGPALSALAEEFGVDYGLLPAETREELARVVGRALKATLSSQLPDGSFGYAPGARQGDSSVTLLQVEAMEAARRAGFEVDAGALQRAGRWLAARLGTDGKLGYREAGDRARDATLTAEALLFAKDLGIGEDARERMLRAVLAEARAAGALEGRVLFRTALLEVLARSGDPEARAFAPDAVRASINAQGAPGSIPAGQDRYAAAAGDNLATARSVRALTAPYRASW